VKPATTAVLGFLISFTCYLLVGLFWLLYDAQFSLTGLTAVNPSTVEAPKIQMIAYASLLAALATAFVIFIVERGGSNLNYAQRAMQNVSSGNEKDTREKEARRTITFSTRSVFRASSVIAGIVSVGWGLYVLQAYALLVSSSSSASSTNPYANYGFLTLSMYEAVVVGLFALVLASLSR